MADKKPGSFIEFQNVRKVYQMGEVSIEALHDVTFTIEKGEICVIVGPSGAGKTTLLNILGGMDRLTSGKVLLEGVEISSNSKREMASFRRYDVGFVFQFYNLIQNLTAIENVELPLFYNNSVPAKERRDRAIEALKLVGLENRMEHMPNQLSGGQQQRVAIARALVNDPVILLADEATGNLDTRTSYEIMSLFQDLHSQGKTIAFVTHEPDIATFTTRKIKLRDGQIIEDAPIDTQSASEALAALNLQKED